jgi:hypothetical protein
MDDLNNPHTLPRPLAFTLEESLTQASLIPWDETTDANGGPPASLTTTVFRLYEPQGCLSFLFKPIRVGCLDFSDPKHWKLSINNKRANTYLRKLADLYEEKYNVSIERKYAGDS